MSGLPHPRRVDDASGEPAEATMALFEPHSQKTTSSSGPTPRLARCRSPWSRTTSSRACTRISRRCTTSRSARRCIPAACRRSSAWASVGRSRARGRRRYRHQRGVVSARFAVTGIDLSGADAREGARPRRAQAASQRAAGRDGCRRPQVRRRHVRHRVRAISDQRRTRSRRGGARDAPRLPSRRPDRHPQPLPQPRSPRRLSSA